MASPICENKSCKENPTSVFQAIFIFEMINFIGLLGQPH
jgi:hypothetical protein